MTMAAMNLLAGDSLMPQTIEATTDISSTATQSGAEGGDAMVPDEAESAATTAIQLVNR